MKIKERILKIRSKNQSDFVISEKRDIYYSTLLLNVRLTKYKINISLYLD